MVSRKEHRRSRRNRKWYREPRFSNRASSKRSGRFLPSIKANVEEVVRGEKMPYNITDWKTKKIENLKISLKVFDSYEDIDIEFLKDGECVVTGLTEGFEIRGNLEGEKVVVKVITNFGEWSGANWEDFLEILKSSVGDLIATVYWEGGDAVERLIAKDGEVETEILDPPIGFLKV